MTTFDMLPKRLRETLANANHNWSCEEAWDAYAFHDERYVIRRIKALDQQLAEQYYADLAAAEPYLTLQSFGETET